MPSGKIKVTQLRRWALAVSTLRDYIKSDDHKSDRFYRNSEMTDHKFTNKLIDETSPYLLQHAHNPVDWYPWGEAALKRAREEDKPILLSIGYSACHWCHVMEHESFENEEIAELMNE